MTETIDFGPSNEELKQMLKAEREIIEPLLDLPLPAPPISDKKLAAKLKEQLGLVYPSK